MDKKIFIDQLFKESSSFNNEKQARGFASLLNTISSDIYSESQRFVFELIQNADDSTEDGENEVQFEFLPDALIVYHNGKVFSEGDINSITDAGASTKIDDPTKTGYKGIGFKSVFGKSDRVSIFSDGYQFRFDKNHHTGVLPWQIIPIWSEIEEYSPTIQRSLSSQRFKVATIIELSGSGKLAQELREIIFDGQILLFLRYVSKITVAINGEMDYSVKRHKQQIGGALEKVSLYQDADLSSEWLVRCFDKIQVPAVTKESLHDDAKTPEKLLKSDFTQLSFAAQLVGGKIRAVKNGESLIYTYLPTKVREFNFPFLVNGSFLTSAAREALFEDRAWNQWLFSLIGQKAMSWLTELSGTEYRLQVLNILPVTFAQDGNELKKAFDASFQKYAICSSFITTGSWGVGSSLQVLLDGTGLSLLEISLKLTTLFRFKLTTCSAGN